MLMNRINLKLDGLKMQPSDDYVRSAVQTLLVRRRVLEVHLKRLENE